MRKELLVFVDSGERGEEVSVCSVSKNRDLVLLSSAVGKFTVSRGQLIDALNTIAEFDKVNNLEASVEVAVPVFEDVQYGED